MARYLYSEIATAVEARRNCIASNNREWHARWENRIKHLIHNYMPSGSGLDNGVKLDLDASHADKLVFYFSFHHMNETGMYDGWTDHTVTVTPSFNGINLRISGRNRNDIKEYLHDTFHAALTQELPDVPTWVPSNGDAGGAIVRTSSNEYRNGLLFNGFDYSNQAWVADGTYISCSHPEDMGCRCYGRTHEGQPCIATIEEAQGIAIARPDSDVARMRRTLAGFERALAINPRDWPHAELTREQISKLRAILARTSEEVR